MRIGILGSGEVGRALGTGFASTGHSVMIGTRHPDQPELREWSHAKPGERLIGTPSETAEYGELLVVSTLGIATVEAVLAAGVPHFENKVVIDTTNPLKFAESGAPELAIGFTTSAGEELQKLLPKAHVVKAFNIVGNVHFFRPSFPGGPPDMYICGNDSAAKKTVTELLHKFGWTSVIDLGGIKSARELESLCILWVKTAMTLGNWNIAFKVLRK